MVPSPLYVHAGHVDLISEEFLRNGMSDSLGEWVACETKPLYRESIDDKMVVILLPPSMNSILPCWPNSAESRG